jgi:hypothetical protein
MQTMVESLRLWKAIDEPTKRRYTERAANEQQRRETALLAFYRTHPELTMPLALRKLTDEYRAEKERVEATRAANKRKKTTTASSGGGGGASGLTAFSLYVRDKKDKYLAKCDNDLNKVSTWERTCLYIERRRRLPNYNVTGNVWMTNDAATTKASANECALRRFFHTKLNVVAPPVQAQVVSGINSSWTQTRPTLLIHRRRKKSRCACSFCFVVQLCAQKNMRDDDALVHSPSVNGVKFEPKSPKRH